MSTVYDAGMLIAADRGDRQAWADHRQRLERDLIPVTTAPVVAQVSRTRRQANLRRLLEGCDVAAFAPESAHRVGELLRKAGTSDVVDAHLVSVAGERSATIVTSDGRDLEALVEAASLAVEIKEI